MLEIAKGIWKLTLGIPESITPINQIKPIKVEEAINQLGSTPLQIDKNHIKFKRNKKGITIELPMNNSEDIYGCGLQLHSLNQAGRRRYLKVNSDPVANTGETHAPVPLIVSSLGYGIYIDTFRYMTLLLGTHARKGESIKDIKEIKEHKEFSESALYALRKSKTQKSMMIDIAGIEGVELYFFEGPDIKNVVQRYNLFSGGGCMPPMWGLGNWYRAYGGATQKDIMTLANHLREDQLPMDVIGIEPGWHTHSYSCSYKWANMRFENPERMIEEISQQSFKINLWEHLFVHPTAEIYESLMPYSGEYEVWQGIVPDFSLEQAQDIFKIHHTREFIDQGILGFKLDECDNSDYNSSNWSFPDSTEFPSGFDGEQMHSAIGVLYQQTLETAFRDRNIRTLSQVRSSGALASSLPFVLYSDLYKHKDFIRGIVTSGFSGLLWAPEIRDCLDNEDLIRRMQSGVFSHHMLLNCWRIPNPPWYQVDITANLAGEKMDKSHEVKQICKQLLELRMSLLPYLYTAFAKYSLTGVPPIRALVMDYPDDFNVREIDDAYMFGEDILVAPLTLEDRGNREVYLPAGRWYNFFTHEKYEGGNSCAIQCNLNTMPVFVKEGSLIPIARPEQAVKKDTIFDIELRSYGKGEKYCELYEDDGISYAYKNNNYNFIRIREHDGVVKFTKEGRYKGTRYHIEKIKNI